MDLIRRKRFLWGQRYAVNSSIKQFIIFVFKSIAKRFSSICIFQSTMFTAKVCAHTRVVAGESVLRVTAFGAKKYSRRCLYTLEDAHKCVHQMRNHNFINKN